MPIVPTSVLGAYRKFHSSPVCSGIRSQVLKDVGEGIMEIQIIQWYVEEGAHVEEWKPLCQYQSDKAVDDITSRYEGVIKKLHFQADDTVPTGKALCDIEVDDAKYPDDNPPPPPAPVEEPAKPIPSEPQVETTSLSTTPDTAIQAESSPPQRSKYATLATPAVRGLLKQLKVDILDITGTGKDGRVMKEDVLKFAAARDSAAAETSAATADTRPSPTLDAKQTENPVPLTPIQSQMFKTMSRSLTIPHFLFADELSVGRLSDLRKRLTSDANNPQKLTFLPFVLKAVSLALEQYPQLNARVDASDPNKPKLVMRSIHNIGVAMDTPQGLIVPNVKNVQARSILDIASEISRLSALGKAGKLTPADLTGGTITVSNIGNIGGTYVSPVIVPTEVAILGIGRARQLPVFDEAGQVTKGELVNFSWSADHRVIDGATMARMASVVRQFIETPELMLLNLR
ncbi:hypothetical protein Plec18167_004730 [Paecilomyces lecythidis]|uniref:Dihydrolipoamide acetyltransferase component of pyruvate dehydrogenase complex n=1 Tax=Paecilomyces lecythidis TaxID=3004212 RepID=A0ABR3XP37_9EURO